ncbi:hypothetical protein [Rhodococcus sp. 27YEA15]|uniref:hypothetical protein n=1 Tax=Rhodococcus sp. 27YEA15 TaxID=3156259 RepID=UPI003C7B3297
MLPIARTHYADQVDAVAGTQTRTEQLPTSVLATMAAALVLLVLSQLYLAQRTPALNPALLAATVLMALLTLWLGTASQVSSAAGEHARVGRHATARRHRERPNSRAAGPR